MQITNPSRFWRAFSPVLEYTHKTWELDYLCVFQKQYIAFFFSRCRIGGGDLYLESRERIFLVANNRRNLSSAGVKIIRIWNSFVSIFYFFALIHYLGKQHGSLIISRSRDNSVSTSRILCFSIFIFFSLIHYLASNNRAIWLLAGVKIIQYASGIFFPIHSIFFLYIIWRKQQGNLIISGSKDNSVRFWDIVSGLLVNRYADTHTHTHTHTHPLDACTRNTAYDECTRNLCCSVLQCVAVCCCSVLQCIAVCSYD